jgi:hypothetical protein
MRDFDQCSLNRWRPLNFFFDTEEFIAPGLSQAFRAFINGAADAETVIALPAFIAGELSTFRAGIKRSGFGSAMFLVKHVFASYAHVHLQSGAALL